MTHLENCFKCIEFCNKCKAVCLNHGHLECIKCCDLCIQACFLCINSCNYYGSNDSFSKQTMTLCKSACYNCYNECKNHNMKECLDCAKICYLCFNNICKNKKTHTKKRKI